MIFKRVAELSMWLAIFCTVIMFGVGLTVPDKFEIKNMIPSVIITALITAFYLVTLFLEKRHEKRQKEQGAAEESTAE